MFEKSPSFSKTGKKFNVIILAAGLGSRLKTETNNIPKPLVYLGKEDMRAIDYTIQKFQYVADRIIIATAYCADILENYIKGKYENMNIFFSRENVSELDGPGLSLIYALDYASSRLPTIITFCDYVIEDYIPVDDDALGLTGESGDPYIMDFYPGSTGTIENGIIVDLVKNEGPDGKRLKVIENGYMGISICHDTMLLKSIAYGSMATKNNEFTFDIIKSYISKRKTLPIKLSKMFEFGNLERLKKTRERLSVGPLSS
jgi:hypothetical protein